MADTWVNVGVSFREQGRETVNNWVIVKIDGVHTSLTPQQAREMAVMLFTAAETAEHQMAHTLVEAPYTRRAKT